MSGIAFVDINTTGRNVSRVESPSFVANAERFLSLGFAVGIFPALDIRAWRFAVYSRRRPDESGFTFTSKRSRCVNAHRRWSTYLTVHPTFVNIDATGSLWLEAILTEALSFDTFGIVCTVKVGAAKYVNIGLLAGDFRIWFSHVSLRAEAGVTRTGILADCVIAAWFVVRLAFIDIDTSPKWISRVFWLT